MTRKKVGLALGAGAALGLAHIGVLKVLKEEKIPIDMIAGTSMGALVGAAYAIEGNIPRIEEIARNLSRMHVLSLVDLTFAKSGLIRGQKMIARGKSLIGRDIQFKDLITPFACVATDILTGQEIVINEGSVLEGVRASISVPGVFSAVKREGKYLVDGGLVDPVPVSIVRDMGADIIIAVNVQSDISEANRTQWMGDKVCRNNRAPNLIEIMMQSQYITSRSLAHSVLRNADIVIEPNVACVGPIEFHRAEECILQGELAAEDVVRRIKHLLA